MKKQELIHLHGVFAEVAAYCDDDGLPVDVDDYGTLDTRPGSIHRSKSAHEEAVFALADAITAAFPEGADPVSAGAD